VHISVKNHQCFAFKVLLGWIKRANRKEILDWKDEDGNTVFHIAALINQTEVRESFWSMKMDKYVPMTLV
jgi:ankyrin repeat protein